MRVRRSGEYGFSSKYSRSCELAPRQYQRVLGRCEILALKMWTSLPARKSVEEPNESAEDPASAAARSIRSLSPGRRPADEPRFPPIRTYQPNVRGFGHQIANGQDQSRGIDDDAVSDTLRAQDTGGKCVSGMTARSLVTDRLMLLRSSPVI